MRPGPRHRAAPRPGTRLGWSPGCRQHRSGWRTGSAVSAELRAPRSALQSHCPPRRWHPLRPRSARWSWTSALRGFEFFPHEAAHRLTPDELGAGSTEIASAMALLEDGVDGLGYQFRFAAQTQRMLEQHRGGKNRGQGVGFVAAGDIRRAAVDWLE